MDGAETRIDRPSALATALLAGLLTLLAPFPGPPAAMAAAVPAAPVPQPVAVTVATPVVLNEVTGPVVAPMAAAHPEVARLLAGRTDPATPGGAPTVALTFDDGPDPRWTPQVLDLLARHHAVATFCMVGEQAQRHPDLVRAVVAAGMRLCDHTASHDERLATRSPERMRAEVLDTQHELAAAGAPVGYFRAPAGNWADPVLELAAGAQMQPLGWSVDPRDWRQPGADAIVTAVQQHVHPGAIVLLHDGGGRRGQTVAALERLLPWLTEQGYRFTFPTP